VQEAGSEKQEVAKLEVARQAVARQGAAAGGAPVRGTQTFVGVMSAVWARPSLMGLEVAWRWVAGALLLVMGMNAFGDVAKRSDIAIAALRNATVFQPVAAFAALGAVAASLLPYVVPGLRWLVPVAVIVWLGIAAIGRTFTLRRLDATLHPRPITMLALGTLRAVVLTALWAAWITLLRWATVSAILRPAAANLEPSLVQFSAIVICGTLFLYVLWGIVSWPFQMAPLLAMLEDKGPLASLGAAFRAGAVSGKLMEVNLVMNIVKLALIVLAMVFSASPLPFTTVATQTFLTCWWTGVILLYFAISDYFHVVRAAAYLRLWRAYK
jgi:hypothetical protein